MIKSDDAIIHLVEISGVWFWLLLIRVIPFPSAPLSPTTPSPHWKWVRWGGWLGMYIRVRYPTTFTLLLVNSYISDFYTMKGLQVLLICSVAVGVLSQSSSGSSSNGQKTRFFGGQGGGNFGGGGYGGGNFGGGGFGGGNFGGGGFGGGNFGGGGFGGGGFGGSSQTCRYWCRTPQGQAYCCENNNKPQGNVGIKPGRCPPVRPSCPPVRSFGPPQTCSNDYSCRGVDKCCFDTCLQEHVCKAPSNNYGFGGFGR